jgi:uncharacterized cupin superfamily protein
MKGFLARSVSRCLLAVAIVAVAATASSQSRLSPVRMDPDKIAGLDLTPVPNDAYIDILVAGELDFNVATLFDGEELRVTIFESTPATTDHRERPLDVDEFVLVLSGKLVLTEQDGTVQEFTPGQMAVLPLGYSGTWEMQGNYRELAITAK